MAFDLYSLWHCSAGTKAEGQGKVQTVKQSGVWLAHNQKGYVVRFPVAHTLNHAAWWGQSFRLGSAESQDTESVSASEDEDELDELESETESGMPATAHTAQPFALEMHRGSYYA